MASPRPDPELASKLFDEIDVDKSGKIDKNELSNLFKMIFKELSSDLDEKTMATLIQESTQEAMKELDKSGDGMVDKAEFIEYMMKP